MKKRIFSILICFAMLTAVLPMGAFADESSTGSTPSGANENALSYLSIVSGGLDKILINEGEPTDNAVPTGYTFDKDTSTLTISGSREDDVIQIKGDINIVLDNAKIKAIYNFTGGNIFVTLNGISSVSRVIETSGKLSVTAENDGDRLEFEKSDTNKLHLNCTLTVNGKEIADIIGTQGYISKAETKFFNDASKVCLEGMDLVSMPGVDNADGAYYFAKSESGEWEKQETSNAPIKLEISTKDGKKNFILTLNNASLETDETKGCGIYCDGDLSIVLNGESSVAYKGSSGQSSAYGIFADGNLNISGSGKLKLEENKPYAMRYGLYSQTGDVNISEEVTVDISALSNGIKAGGDVNISGGNIKISAESNGIEAGEDVNITDGDVEIKAMTSQGIRAVRDVSITGGKTDISVKINEGDLKGIGISSEGKVAFKGGSTHIVAQNAVQAKEFAFERTLIKEEGCKVCRTTDDKYMYIGKTGTDAEDEYATDITVIRDEAAYVLTVSEKPTASNIKSGNSLSDSSLSGGVVKNRAGQTISGTWAWKAPETKMSQSGAFNMTAVFTASDAEYNTVEADVSVTVTQVITPGGGSSSSSGSGSSSSYSYTYTVTFETNGGIKVSSQSVKSGSTAYEPNAPFRAGFAFDGWYADRNLKQKYNFSTPVTANIVLYAKWTGTGETGTGFSDVKTDDWFCGAVNYVVGKKLFNGVSDNEFAPNDSLTRAMLVTILYRLDGEPETEIGEGFADVESGAYYEKAVAWAKANGIVNGITDSEFAPNNNITREQIASIIYRYAKYKGYDVSVGEDTNILSYEDANKISDWAVAAIQWACGASLINGRTESTIVPDGTATRAEAAAIMQRFSEQR